MIFFFRIMIILLATIAGSVFQQITYAQEVCTISTIAGTGEYSYTGADIGTGGQATAAKLGYPEVVLIDPTGLLLISEENNHMVRKLLRNGTIVAVAGSGNRSSPFFSGDGGPAVAAALNEPNGLALDTAGNLYISDTVNHRVRMVSAADQTITTVIGTGEPGYTGDGGAARNAQIDLPTGLVFDASGNLYIGDRNSHVVRKVSLQPNGTIADGVITTFAGTGSSGFSGDGGPATTAQLSDPYGLVFDPGGNLYIADEDNGRVRKVSSQEGTISTFVGPGLNEPEGLAMDIRGNLYIAENEGHRIRKVTSERVISTLAGTGISGFSGDGRPASEAQLSYPKGVAIDQTGNIYIADTHNNRVRKIICSLASTVRREDENRRGMSLSVVTDLALTMSAFPSPGLVGHRENYTINIVNNGPNIAEGVTLTNIFSGALTFETAQASQGSCTGTNKMICSLGRLINKQSVQVKISVIPSSAGVINSRASISSSASDSNTANNLVQFDISIN